MTLPLLHARSASERSGGVSRQIFTALFFLPALFLSPICLAAESASEQAVLRKLDEISTRQLEIKKDLEDIKAELQVVKVRATRS